MNAIKLHIIVPESREVTITLPSDVPPGEAEVIVLTKAAPSTASRGSWERVRMFLAQTLPAHPGRTKEEIDRFLAEERAGWGDDE
jgi:hypothetical protein